jgi:plasmid stabilization system protein ParE
MDRIRRQPAIYTRVYEEYRRALIRRFPYAVFEYTETAVTVYAVFHKSRDPEKWRLRPPEAPTSAIGQKRMQVS